MNKQAINVQLDEGLYEQLIEAGRKLGLVKPDGGINISQTVRSLLIKALKTDSE